MKLGVFSPALADKSLDDALTYLEEQGAQMIELGTGGYPGTAHCDAAQLIRDDAKLAEFKATMARHNIQISALSCHGNPIHPNKEIAKQFDDTIRDTILLAEKLGITQINTFSGCPGDSEDAKYPNWVTCPWPDDYSKILEWQWNEVLIPYWKKTVAFAKEHGVTKIGLELHPGFCVYNSYTLLKLRNAVGEEIGANLDPSHLIWQGMDPVAVIRELGPAIFHFHAKDTKIDQINTAVNGVLDTQHYSDEIHRSWIFRSVGYGMDAAKWKEIISTLRLVGYDYAISIEHEDSLMTPYEGLGKAISFLKEILIFESKGEMWWA
ncbi:MAG: sugar phosphate isomerase/epimerase [Clostridiales bacterium]|nr:sugar phosphate isomerase/epimerase [Clostridiales bacterium]